MKKLLAAGRMEDMLGKKGYYALGGAILLFVAAAIVVFVVGPEQIVTYVGVKSSYTVVFLLGAIAGLSTLTSSSFYTALVTFASGGANPFILGLVGGLGMFISDSIFYNLALYGKRHVPDSWQKGIARLAEWGKRYPTWLILLVAFITIAFIPLPNDLIMLVLVALGFPYIRVAPLLLVGDITISIWIAYFAQTGSSFF